MFFYMKINIKVFDKLALLFLLVIARHVQNTQCNVFAISLKDERDEVDCEHAEKRQTILQIITNPTSQLPIN